MDKRSIIWQLAAQENNETNGTANDALPVTVEIEDEYVPSDGRYQEPDLMAQFKGSVTTMLVLEDMQAKLNERVAKGEAFCRSKEHMADVKAFKLLQKLYLEQADLESRIKLEAKIQGELEARICDVPNEYICARCFTICRTACQCGKVA